MQIVRDMAGYSYGRSDLVRRVMSKKKEAEMLKEEQYFIFGREADEDGDAVPGCVANGIPEETAREIFQVMIKFASYAFNKSHATAYAVVAFQTAWLKCHYRAEFMAALMSSVIGDPTHINLYINDCREAGIKVLPPDIYRSQKKFTVEDGAIRFGLLAVKGVGSAVIDDIIRARTQVGMPNDFEDFVNQLDMSRLNKKAMEGLVLAGAFDCIDDNRARLRIMCAPVMEAVQSRMRNNVAGQMSLFSDFGEELNDAARAGGAMIKIGMPDITPYRESEKLSLEKEVLGVYVSGHPLQGVRDELMKIADCTSAMLSAVSSRELETEGYSSGDEVGYGEYLFDREPEKDFGEIVEDGQVVTMAGIISGVRNMVTKKNTMMAFVQLEDLFGITEVIVFPNTFEEVRDHLAEDNIVVINGKLQFREDEDPKLIAYDIMSLEEHSLLPVILTVPRGAAGGDLMGVMRAIKKAVADNPGTHPLFVRVEAEGRWLKPEGTIENSDDFYNYLEPVIGRQKVTFARRKKRRRSNDR